MVLSNCRVAQCSFIHELLQMLRMSNCIFCKIIAKELPSEILYEDDDLSIFKDIKPAAKFHYLAVPKEHIVNVNALTSNHNRLLNKLVENGRTVLEENGGDMKDIRLGFHNPPFNSVPHLHLHIISPASSMSLINRLIFKPNTWWFSSVEQIVKQLSSEDSR